MSSPRFGKIRRSEFERRAPEFEQTVTRCAVGLRVPNQFRSLREECTPTHAEACGFENISVERVHRNEGRSIADEQGWKRLGCGVGRCTFKFKPRCVVKFARSARRPTTTQPNRVVGYGEFNGVTGEESNTYEVASYELADEAVKNFLNPIIAHAPAGTQHGYKWIVQPLVKTERDLGDNAGSVMSAVRAGLKKAHAECEDIHYGNIGLLLDKYPVLIDYGFSVRCKRIGKVSRKGEERKLAEFMPDGAAYKREYKRKVDELAAGKTKHRGRHGLRRPRGEAPMGVLTRRRRILWAEAGALRRKAKDIYRYPAPDRQKMLEDARFLEQQAWMFQTKLLGKKQRTPDISRMLGLLNQTKKEAFFPAAEGI